MSERTSSPYEVPPQPSFSDLVKEVLEHGYRSGDPRVPLCRLSRTVADIMECEYMSELVQKRYNGKNPYDARK
jgi:hypothetical protein